MTHSMIRNFSVRTPLVFLLVLSLATQLLAVEETDEMKVRAILIRWVEALGGAQNIQDLRSVDYRCRINYGADRASVELHVRSNAEGHYRYDYELPQFGRWTQAYDGRLAWQQNDQLGSGPLSEQEHLQNRIGINFRSPIKVWKAYPEKKILPDEIVDGRRLQVLSMEDINGISSKWYFDPTTGLRVRLELPEVVGGPLVIEYSDFRRVGSVREPFRTTRTQAGKQIEIVTHTVLYNEEVDPILVRPTLDYLEESREITRILVSNRMATGIDAVRDITTRVTAETTDITTSGITFPTVISQKLPNLIVLEMDVPGMGKLRSGYDGRVGWSWSELQGYRTMQGAELQQLLNSADLQGAMRFYDMCPLRRLLDEREDHGQRSVGIALATSAGPAGKLYFDLKSGQLVRMESIVQAGANGKLNIVAEFSDFRRVDGLSFPFRTVITNPAMQMITTIQSIKHNVRLEDEIFLPKQDD